MKLPHLMPRLQKIYDIVPPCSVAADIGTDHAYIPVCLTKSKKCERAIASDIGKGPLERARATVLKYGEENNISLRLGGGLSTVATGEAQTIIIAGMGGILISRILDEAKETAKKAQTLILQPMTAAEKLREYLVSNGFKTEKEYLVAEDEKIYTIIVAAFGKDLPYSAAELYMGKYAERDELYARYRKMRLLKLQKRIDGLAASKNPENQKTLNQLLNLREMIENENL